MHNLLITKGKQFSENCVITNPSQSPCVSVSDELIATSPVDYKDPESSTIMWNWITIPGMQIRKRNKEMTTKYEKCKKNNHAKIHGNNQEVWRQDVLFRELFASVIGDSPLFSEFWSLVIYLETKMLETCKRKIVVLVTNEIRKFVATMCKNAIILQLTTVYSQFKFRCNERWGDKRGYSFWVCLLKQLKTQIYIWVKLGIELGYRDIPTN